MNFGDIHVPEKGGYCSNCGCMSLELKDYKIIYENTGFLQALFGERKPICVQAHYVCKGCVANGGYDLESYHELYPGNKCDWFYVDQYEEYHGHKKR